MRLPRNTPEEEAAIQAGIDADPDAPAWTAADFVHSVRVRDMTTVQLDTMVPASVAADERRRRGAQVAPTKQPVSLRLDRDVVDALRLSGRGWQGRANMLLRKAMGL